MDASDVYELSVERHAGRWKRPLRVAGSLAETVLLGNMMLPSTGDCVVRRIADAHEVLRFADDGSTYAEVEHQLATMSASEFAERWAISD